MGKYTIIGGNRLEGEVNIQGSKNSVLPILAATILNCNKSIISNCPNIMDVTAMINILEKLGCKIDFENNVASIDSENMNIGIIPEELVKVMRSSITLLGPILSRFKKVRIAFPGGCTIGNRPIDIHIKALKLLGAKIIEKQGYLYCEANKLKGNKIFLDFPSVGATENIMLAATMAEGETIISNCAKEPEIVDLARFLKAMGAQIRGEGTDTIRILGVRDFKEVVYKPIYDRIEAGTFMITAAITKSLFKINGIDGVHLKPIIAKLTEMGIAIEINKNSMIVDGRKKLNPVDIKTMPYPGFPTDMQAQMMSLLCTVKGTSIITETIFENRFMQAVELKRMGANIKIDGRSAVIEGIDRFTGSEVTATDLRAGAALILAGLTAEGSTTINDIYHIDRGYVSIEQKLKGLGADIERVSF